MARQYKSYLVLFLAVASVSWASIFIKLSDAPSLIIAFYRMGLSSFFLLPFFIKKGLADYKALTKNELLLCLLSGVFLGFHFVTWISSLAYTSVSSSVVIVATQPVFVALFTPMILKEKIDFWVFVAIIIALIGIFIIAGGDIKIGQTNLKGDFLSLIGAIMAALYLTLGRSIRRKMNLFPYIFLVYSLSTLVIFIFCIFAGVNFSPLTWKNLVLFILLALIPTLIGHTLYNYILKFVKAHLVGMTILGEPLGATLWAFLILKEIPASTIYIGGILIFMGIGIAVWRERALG
ncbi:MAG: DMT family transporter [candidate division Zixibacteria bacterium]|nr:DMT family transporter [candidate division Zixibacteria bacterium]